MTPGVFVGFEFGFTPTPALPRIRGGCIDAAEGVGRGGLEVEVEGHQLLAPRGPLGEVLVEGEAGEFALEVEFVLFAVGRVVEHAVGVVEDGVARGGANGGIEGGMEVRRRSRERLAIVRGELGHGPSGDVIVARAVVVPITREALGIAVEVQINQVFRRQRR